MRRLALAVALSCVAFMFGAGPAMADNGPHMKGAGVLSDGCGGCHRIHSAKTAELTKDPQPQLCYTCHGKTGTGADTDVVEGVGRGALTGALRGGGFEYALLDSGHAESTKVIPASPLNKVPTLDPAVAGTAAVATTSSHSVDGSDQPAWGMGVAGTVAASATIQLRCGSCHDPHGNGNYRILRPLPEQGTTSPGTATPLVAFSGVIKDEATKNYTTTNYWDVADTTADPAAPAAKVSFIGNISQWCSQCHTRYLATRDSGGTLTTPAQRSRFDSGDATFTIRHTTSSTTSGGSSRSCIQCHVAHGTNAKMGPISGAVGNPDGTAGVVGDSRLLKVDNRGTCKMCHTEGN
jgi:predicted CXXCH cytochrome family protein